MAATIVVTPERLRGAAAAASALAGRLLEVRAHLGATVTGLDGAFGDGQARAAFAALWARWTGSAQRLEAAVERLAATLEAAADGYERADRGSAHAGPAAARSLTVGSPGGGPAQRGGADATAR
jgi:WXG100 family type VII secretion target